MSANQNSAARARKYWGIGALSLGFVLLALLVAAKLAVGDFNTLLFGLSLASGCKESVVSEVSSPNRQLRAVLYVSDCGATTRAATIVTILPAGQSKPQNRSVRVFAGYEYPWDTKSHKIRPEWLSDRSLRVHYTRDVELTALNNWAEGVSITYQLEDAPL